MILWNIKMIQENLEANEIKHLKTEFILFFFTLDIYDIVLINEL
jgi:hypothetical protein